MFTWEDRKTGIRHAFHGTATHALAWQCTRVILQVEHDNAMGRFSLAIPYRHFLVPGWVSRIFETVAGWVFQESDDAVDGTSIDVKHQIWEVDDDVQRLYALV